jgi:outer membrane protein assembly factor BamB
MRTPTRAARPTCAVWLLLCLAAPAAGGPPSDWTRRGGPTGDFKVSAPGLATWWPASGPPVIWERDLGPGYSGILFENDRLYTQFRRGANHVVTALDASSGETLWEFIHPSPVYPEQNKDFGIGPNATPLIVGQRIYSVDFGSRLYALDKRSGEKFWSHDLVREFGGQVVTFGYSSSPVAWNGMVLLLLGAKEHGAIGFDARDGSVRLRTSPFGVISYATPIVADVQGEAQLMTMTATEVVGVSLKDGKVRWRRNHENQYQTNCAGPWWDGNGLLFVSSQADAGSRTLRLSRSRGRTLVEQVARSPGVKFFHGAAVLVGDHVYGVSGDTLVAHDFKRGEDAWRESGFAESNVLWVGGRALLLDQRGNLTLASVSPAGLEVHARHRVLGKPAWTAPTLVGTRLYLRDTNRIVALDLSAP